MREKIINEIVNKILKNGNILRLKTFEFFTKQSLKNTISINFSYYDREKEINTYNIVFEKLEENEMNEIVKIVYKSLFDGIFEYMKIYNWVFIGNKKDELGRYDEYFFVYLCKNHRYDNIEKHLLLNLVENDDVINNIEILDNVLKCNDCKVRVFHFDKRKIDKFHRFEMRAIREKEKINIDLKRKYIYVKI